MDFYISEDILYQLLDHMDLYDIYPFFTTNKELLEYINQPNILKYISDKWHMPYVTNFNDLVYYIYLHKDDLYYEIYKLGDIRLIKHYRKYNRWIHIAARYGHLDVIKEIGAINDDIVREAAIYYHLDIVKYVADKYGTPRVSEPILGRMIYLIDCEDKNIINSGYIRNKDKDCNAYSKTYGYFDIVRYCVENGGYVNKFSLHYAVLINDLDLLVYLLDNIRDKDVLEVIPQCLKDAILNKYNDIAKYLLRYYLKKTYIPFLVIEAYDKRNMDFINSLLKLIDPKLLNKVLDDIIVNASYKGYLELVEYIDHIRYSMAKYMY